MLDLGRAIGRTDKVVVVQANQADGANPLNVTGPVLVSRAGLALATALPGTPFPKQGGANSPLKLGGVSRSGLRHESGRSEPITWPTPDRGQRYYVAGCYRLAAPGRFQCPRRSHQAAASFDGAPAGIAASRSKISPRDVPRRDSSWSNAQP